MRRDVQMQTITAISLVIAFSTAIAPTPAFGAEKASWVSVPVYFATSRQFDDQKNTYTGYRNREKHNQNVDYGIVTVAVDLPPGQTIDKQEVSKLGWKLTDKKTGQKLENIAQLSIEDFYKSLQMKHQSTEFKETCVFVHGYNNKFGAAARSAARLSIALKEPVVLFSWPSAGKTKNYTTDECNAEWSVRPFQVFLQGLVNRFEAKQVMTVSHSMGNRLVNWYLQSRFDNGNAQPKKFSEVVLTSPDIDRATFRNYFYKVAANGEKTRIFVSKKDLPLRLSKFVHGNPRTGSDLAKDEQPWELPGNIEGTQTVNFTEVDSGKMGHSIQYEVIGNMHRTNKPGTDLTAEPDPTYKGDYLHVRRVAR